MRSIPALASAFLLTAIGCTQPIQAPPEIDLEAERASLMQADRTWSESQVASDTPVDVIAAQFLEDAYLLAPDAPLIEGSDDIRGAFADLEAIPGYSLSWKPTVAEVGGAGDLGYTIGAYEMHMAPEGTPLTIIGKYMTIWKRQPNGDWKVAVDMFNADGPPASDEE
jgi:ketosteroid isomerase-like protein